MIFGLCYFTKSIVLMQSLLHMQSLLDRVKHSSGEPHFGLTEALMLP
uniref:Uncharacterized protein n=1 Tax=Rhizophora mucronata TaxID=61149 RepID=A0A2P2N2I5_RHIMU